LIVHYVLKKKHDLSNAVSIIEAGNRIRNLAVCLIRIKGQKLCQFFV